jgi:hypothetical protein
VKTLAAGKNCSDASLVFYSDSTFTTTATTGSSGALNYITGTSCPTNDCTKIKVTHFDDEVNTRDTYFELKSDMVSNCSLYYHMIEKYKFECNNVSCDDCSLSVTVSDVTPDEQGQYHLSPKTGGSKSNFAKATVSVPQEGKENECLKLTIKPSNPLLTVTPTVVQITEDSSDEIDVDLSWQDVSQAGESSFGIDFNLIRGDGDDATVCKDISLKIIFDD